MATHAWLEKHVPDGAWVLQEYVMDPLTFKGHKFDVRLWAVVTSLEPLRVYVLRRGIPKISQMRYSARADKTKDQCMHILLPGTTECFQSKEAEVVWPYPNSTDVPSFLSHLGKINGKTCDAACWWRTVWPSAEWRVVEVLLLARARVIEHERKIQASGKRYKRVVLLQPDLVFDSRGNAALVECNMNGYMVGDAHKAFFSLQAETEALLELVGASGYPRQLKYAHWLNSHLDSFCQQQGNGCSRTNRLELSELVHETHHAHTGWVKAFPTGEDKPHMAHFKRTPQWAAMLTRRDRLNIRWLRFKRQSLPHAHPELSDEEVMGGGGLQQPETHPEDKEGTTRL